MLKKQKIPKIEELIEDIPDNQLNILKDIWNHFLQNKEWPNERRFHKKHGRENVKRVINNLNSIFIRHVEQRPSGHYKLTTEGVFAIEGAEGPNIKLLLSFLDFLKTKFDKDPEFKATLSHEVKKKFHLNSDEVWILGELVSMGNSNLKSGSTFSSVTSDWKIGTMDEIDILYESNTSLEFLLKQWNDNIERIVTYRLKEAPDILGINKSQIRAKIVEQKDKLLDKNYLKELYDSANLHPNVKSNSESLFVTNHFSQAIFESLKALESEIKEVSKLDFGGQDLINMAFKENDPKIKLNPMNDISERDEQAGFRFIFMGVMRGIRNPIAHTNANWSDSSLALKYLCMISLLFEKLDNRVFPKN